MTNDTCKNCGGWRGLHHWETNQCHVGGVEAPIGKKQEWKTTTFEAEDDTTSRIAELEAQKKRLVEIVDRLCWSIEHGDFPKDSIGMINAELGRALLAEVEK